MRKQPKSPCYKCAKREVGCHGTCEEYAEFCKKREEIKHKHHLEWEVNDYQTQIQKRNMARQHCRKGAK